MLYPNTIILLYHRIAEPSADPWKLRVTPAHFAEHMEVLRNSTRVVPLAECRTTRDRERPVVSVTFDDGYSDNLLVAGPIMERLDIPATVFVMTAGLAHDHTPWWDELEECTLSSRYFETWRQLRDTNEDDREAALAELLTAAGRRRHEGSENRLMRADEVSALAAGGLIEVGAHTRSHPSLASLPVAQQEGEIADSRADLEAVLGKPVCGFSYPFGTHEHYTPATVRLVRETGFAFACANQPHLVRPESSDLELPRLHVNDMDGAAFERWLHVQLESAR
jgi:peptidoglycan/xylan/chitin deacetylase (PgdA/CDA1 family)